jgi:small subunit ribosomal protein S18
MAKTRSRGPSRGTGRAAAGRRPVKKKVCIFCADKAPWVDYKDVNLLRRFMSERAKIRARRVTGNCAQHQREVATAIKTARELALLPYGQRQVTERTKGGRRGRDRDESTELRAPTVETEALEVEGLEEEGFVAEGEEFEGEAGVPRDIALPEAEMSAGLEAERLGGPE